MSLKYLYVSTLFKDYSTKLFNNISNHYFGKIDGYGANEINDGTTLFSIGAPETLRFLNTYDQKYGLMKMPTVDGTRRINTGHLHTLSVLKSYDATGHFEEEKARAAFKLLKFLETDENFQVSHFGQLFDVPVNSNTINSQRYIDCIKSNENSGNEYKLLVDGIKEALNSYDSYKFINNSINTNFLLKTIDPLLRYLFQKGYSDAPAIRLQQIDNMSATIYSKLNEVRPL